MPNNVPHSVYTEIWTEWGTGSVEMFSPNTTAPLWFLLPGTRHGQVWGVGSQAELSCHADIQTTGCSSPMQCQTRHHLSPLRQSQLLIIARCQRKPLISSAHSEVAVYLPSSITCFSVSYCSTAHAMEALSSCLHTAAAAKLSPQLGLHVIYLTHGCIYFLSTHELQ